MDKILSAKRTSSDFDGMLMNKTLDPVDAAGWAQLRAVGHRMLDEMFTHLEGLREIPVWQAMPEG
jgi:hypothetical protein